MKNEIIIYSAKELASSIEVRLDDETMWLTQSQIVQLFNSSKANISEHIKNIFETGELDEQSTVRIFRTVQIEGGRKVSRNILYYNLDIIISVGYRVNSMQGTLFRIWANKVLKDYLLKGYAINNRIDKLENDVHNIKNKLGDIDVQLKTSLHPNEGIFFDGQIFDAYVFVCNLIKSAKKSIILIDNYIDESILTILAKRNKNVSATIFCSDSSKQLKLDLKKHNEQYPEIMLKTFSKSHDRFLIIDNDLVYHIGASLKDLGKKWFAFSKLQIDAKEFIKLLES